MPLKTVKAPSSPAMSRMDQEEAGPAVASAWYSSTAASSGKFIRAPPFTGSTTAISFPYLRATSSHFRHWGLGALPVRTVALKLHQLNYLDGLGGSSYRRLGQYGVSVYPQHLAALEQAGALEHLEDGSVVLRDIGLYTQTTGLTLEPSGGNALFIG